MRIPRKQAEEGVLVSPSDAYTEMSLSKLRSKLSETLNRVQYGKKCVLVTNYGKRVAQLLPVPEELGAEQPEGAIVKIRSLLQGLPFVGQAEGERLTYYVFEGNGTLPCSIAKQSWLNMNVVDRETPEDLSSV